MTLLVGALKMRVLILFGLSNKRAVISIKDLAARMLSTRAANFVNTHIQQIFYPIFVQHYLL